MKRIEIGDLLDGSYNIDLITYDDISYLAIWKDSNSNLYVRQILEFESENSRFDTVSYTPITAELYTHFISRQVCVRSLMKMSKSIITHEMRDNNPDIIFEIRMLSEEELPTFDIRT
tara:strand:- start:22784 stop:23134 length:351 start_codon:yes stop_codon:yes gene_type:complete